ncbi:MAG TPA: hypothetical protein VFU86_13215 [Terriglobales bacterium]|nr:hypothetical protein [Terriglobales bacterium]
MPEAQRKLLLFAEDKDLAELAAFGLRMRGGWEPVIATTAPQASTLARKEAVSAIAFIVVQPSPKLPRTITKLLALCSELEIRLVGITPDPSVREEFALLGVSASCTPFDPIAMWSHLPAIA